MATTHPDHASEQAYIERAHRAEQRMRERREHMPEAGADKVSARKLRELASSLSEPVDPESLCFGRIDAKDGKSLYLGRGQVREEGNELLVVNWRMPAAAPFYTATRNDSKGLTLRRRFQLDQLRLLGIVDEKFQVSQPAPDGRPVESGDNTATASQPDIGTEGTSHEPEIVDAILAQMDRARGTTMRDIVATIEARQYELISDSLEGVLVIQGGPGRARPPSRSIEPRGCFTTTRTS